MKKLLLVLLSLALSYFANASHVHSSEIRIEHISNFDYKIHVIMLRDRTGIPVPQTASVEVYQRVGGTLINTITLNKDTTYVINPGIIGCPPVIQYDRNEYSATITLPPTTYNHPGGYLFHWQTCCRNPGAVNIQNPMSTGQAALLLFPPVVDNMGNQILNNSPVLNSPINDFALDLTPYSNDFGGTDPDGDSLAYSLVTPFSSGSASAGIVNNVFSPYPNPATQIPTAQWAPGFNQNNQIHGFPGPNPSPNRLQIDSITGELTITPNVAQGIFLYTIECREFRNGVLIGATYRDNYLYIFNPSNLLISNVAPVVHVPANQALSTWSGDTLIFTGSPVCVQLDVTDADTVADIHLELIQSDYDTSDISFLQNSAIIRNNDTFNTAICFSPDSFLAQTSEARVIAVDNLCHNVKSDTLSFFFKFVGYSNAGLGGTQVVPITPSMGAINLFSLLSGNPIPGGIWVDIDSTGLINASNEFIANYVNSPVSYDFLYIQQEPNYPPDTAFLTLDFRISSALSENLENDIQVYPNPSSGEVTLVVPQEYIGSNGQIFSYDLKLMDSFRLEESNSIIQIDRPGLYFIRVEGQPVMKKVIVR